MEEKRASSSHEGPRRYTCSMYIYRIYLEMRYISYETKQISRLTRAPIYAPPSSIYLFSSFLASVCRQNSAAAAADAHMCVRGTHPPSF